MLEELNSLIQNAKFEFNEINSSVTKAEINFSLPKSIFEKYGKEKLEYRLAIIMQDKWLETKFNSIIGSMFEYSNKLLLKERNLKVPLNVESERPTLPYLKIKLNFLETKTRLPLFIREV